MDQKHKIDELELQLEKLGFELLSVGYADETALNNGDYAMKSLTLPMQNRKLEAGPFFFKKENSFVHWTSEASFYNIIQSKTLRLYNLMKMDDPLEMAYGLKELAFPKHLNIIEQKERIFCLSMCPFSALQADERKEHVLWKLHGRDGYGVMLRLAFNNDMRSWEQYHLSHVFYHLDHLVAIRDLHHSTDKIILDPKVSCFIKHHIYEFEEEVRLIFDSREERAAGIVSHGNNRLHPVIHPDCLTDKKNIAFVQIPIKNLPFQHGDPAINYLHYCNRIPHIIIEEIVLGYRFDEQAVNRVSSKLQFAGIDIPVSRSRLADYYPLDHLQKTMDW